MKPIRITMREREIIRQALGLNKPEARGKGFRNRFFAGGNDLDICRGLVRKGLAIEIGGNGAFPLFNISTAGFLAAKREKETMDEEETARMIRIDQAIAAARVDTEHAARAAALDPM